MCQFLSEIQVRTLFYPIPQDFLWLNHNYWLQIQVSNLIKISDCETIISFTFFFLIAPIIWDTDICWIEKLSAIQTKENSWLNVLEPKGTTTTDSSFLSPLRGKWVDNPANWLKHQNATFFCDKNTLPPTIQSVVHRKKKIMPSDNWKFSTETRHNQKHVSSNTGWESRFNFQRIWRT